MFSMYGQRAGDATGPELQPKLVDLALQRTGNLQLPLLLFHPSGRQPFV